ncbi:TIGR02285 family protein [Magnetococcus sp. PR-3]|uniref:TIGR02285 family protein n=1 Tax=Magnetococcus sp. PR-3 TaxID=3120355 RepID=UPI002FCE4D0D
MPHRPLIHMFVLLLYLQAIPAMAQMTPTNIRWLIFDFPPIYVVSGPLQGQGFVDHMEQDIKQRLPQYQHSRSTTNIKRVLETIKAQQQVCASGLLWTENQAQYITYSLPFMFVLPAKFVIRAEDLPRFQPYLDPNGALSLRQLLNQTDLILGYTHARAYSKTLAPIIEHDTNPTNSLASNRDSVTKPLINMLNHKRFDYTIAFPSEVRFLAQELSIAPETFLTIPILESNWAQHAYVGCPKTPWGEQVIARVNQEIKKLRTQPGFMEHYLYWLDQPSKQQYNRLVAQGFHDTFPPKPPHP